MKCITVQQPWASLIASGKKKTEFRTWRLNYRGPLAIHAGQGIDREECERVGLDADSLPRGVLLCVVNMYGCVKLREGYGWKLRNVRKIRPIKMRGKLGLWKIPEKSRVRKP